MPMSLVCLSLLSLSFNYLISHSRTKLITASSKSLYLSTQSVVKNLTEKERKMLQFKNSQKKLIDNKGSSHGMPGYRVSLGFALMEHVRGHNTGIFRIRNIFTSGLPSVNLLSF